MEKTILNQYIEKLNNQSIKVKELILAQQQKEISHLSNVNAHLNIILMVADDKLSLNGGFDTNFSFHQKLLEDKKVWKNFKKHEEKILQKASLNNQVSLILAILLKKYLNQQIQQFNHQEKLLETLLLTNVKNVLKDSDLINKILIPYSNILIYSAYNKLEELTFSYNELLANLETLEKEENDYLYLKEYLIKELQKKQIIKIKKV